MKAATSTLQEQLVQQSGIFMTDPKEPNFFSDDDQYRRGVDWYQGLFANAQPGDLRGEASTHYSKLPTYPDTVGRLHALLPELRLVYVMRHPIDRLVSHYIHEWSMGNVRCSLDEAVERYPELVEYGRYTMQLSPYLDVYGKQAVLPVFFDRLRVAPQGELKRICRFIGYDGQPVWQTALKASNQSSERIRRFRGYDFVIGSRAAIWARRAFVPKALRNRIKTRLTMPERPILSTELLKRLETIFDQDLHGLGQWLGVELACRNFKSLTESRELNWRGLDAWESIL